ncbi:MAG: CDGSH iron-sulfur domain-containing protein [bacterium]
MSDDSAPNAPSIRPLSNGPLVVKQLKRLTNSRDEPLETKDSFTLCRCGASANKPFCDGSHRKIGFSDENTADRSKDVQITYAGKEISIHDNRFLCSHAAFCTDRLKSVFKQGEAPWIDPDGDTAEAIAGLVGQCPSGALSFTFQASPPRPEAPEAGITVSKNGPYFVVGEVSLEGAGWSKDADRRRFALCRCGASANKPFCDGSHWEAGFSDEKN